MKLKLFLLTFLFLGILSCKKEEDPAPAQNPVETFDDGVIILGPDDCGFLLSLPKAVFKPVNLGLSFQVNGLAVKGEFRRKSSNAICGLKKSVYQNISILAISNR